MRKRKRGSQRAKAPGPSRELALCGRDQRGRFTRANTEQRTHGAYSVARWQELAAVITERRTALLTQKGFTGEDVPPSLSIIIDALIEADVMRSSFFTYITATGGPLSVKGRTRRAVEGWSRACDRCTKLAGMIGLTRKPRHPGSLEDWLAGHDENVVKGAHIDGDDTPDTLAFERE